jgi:hypothetical protein
MTRGRRVVLTAGHLFNVICAKINFAIRPAAAHLAHMAYLPI